MKLLSKLSIIFAFAVLLTFTASSAFANNNKDNYNNNNHIVFNFPKFPTNIWNHPPVVNHNKDKDKGDDFCKKNPRDNKCKKENDDNNCKKHPEKSECHVSVPEFGVIPGAVAALSSGGAFLYLKKKKYN